MTLDCKKFFSISNHSRPSGYKFRIFPLPFQFFFITVFLFPPGFDFYKLTGATKQIQITMGGGGLKSVNF